jgi:hypothetical protein
MEFDEVADELYRLAPADFVAARDAKVKEARRGGQGELAKELATLRRPTTGAFLANQLAWGAPEQIAQLAALGSGLKRAQERLHGDELRRLSKERQRLMAALRTTAVELAHQHGVRAGQGAQDELGATLEAALADEEAARAVREGRLTEALAYSGLGLTEGPGDDRRRPGPPPRPRPASTPRRAHPAGDDGRHRDLERLKEAASAARSEARRRAEEAEAAAQDLEAAEAALARAEAELGRRRDERRAAREQRRAAEQRRAEAEGLARRAEEAAARAEGTPAAQVKKRGR